MRSCCTNRGCPPSSKIVSAYRGENDRPHGTDRWRHMERQGGTTNRPWCFRTIGAVFCTTIDGLIRARHMAAGAVLPIVVAVFRHGEEYQGVAGDR